MQYVSINESDERLKRNTSIKESPNKQLPGSANYLECWWYLGSRKVF